jgi:hypothetical protein
MGTRASCWARWALTGSGATGTSLPLQNVATIYSRIKAIAPYFEDTYKMTQKLTVSLGCGGTTCRHCTRSSTTSPS